jgi:5-methylthioribose kinase
MAWELTGETARDWLVEHGLVGEDAALEIVGLAGGVSASVLAVRSSDGAALVVKQALPRLRVSDVWLAKQERAETEAAAMRLCRSLSGGFVPAVLAVDPVRHVVAMELVEGCTNWQAEVGAGRAHAEAGVWAGATLAAWHRATEGREDVAAAFDDYEAFEQQRLRPFHETVMARLPEVADAIAPYLTQLRGVRRCLVHGDYAMKNMLVGDGGRWVLDFEVAHTGNPVFDLGFFLSFTVLSAVRWPALAGELRMLADGFLTSYASAAGSGFAGDEASITGHTACLVLARTDGTSPAQFLDDASRARAREVGMTLLREPDRGLWAWL